ncbi:hypothetical protein E4U39_001190 [Claviceps sp. Clav50 group G5]|nr:hypothetical protein E4U39_001190 [Claviceps sp. Clav50 group G5]
MAKCNNIASTSPINDPSMSSAPTEYKKLKRLKNTIVDTASPIRGPRKYNDSCDTYSHCPVASADTKHVAAVIQKKNTLLARNSWFCVPLEVLDEFDRGNISDTKGRRKRPQLHWSRRRRRFEN